MGKVCDYCGHTITQSGSGRERKYCSDKCKQAAYRERSGGEPKRKILNTVRTDTLEGRIALYEAQRRYDASEALRWLAQSIGAPISEAMISRRRSQVVAQLERESAGLNALLTC